MPQHEGMTVPREAGLGARLLAAHVEVSHLAAIATHPATRRELASIEDMLSAPTEDLEATLVNARKRLRHIHNAIAMDGPGAALEPRES
jgi:hypothetical protein